MADAETKPEETRVAAKQAPRGWWMPGGFVEAGENFHRTAHTRTMAEAGIKIFLRLARRA